MRGLPRSGRRIVVRKKPALALPPPPPPPSTLEVLPEDILLETYIVEPQRAAPPAPHTLKMLPQPPIDPAMDRAVDELLMMTPSVAPVAMPSVAPQPLAPPQKTNAAVIASALLVLVGALAFAAAIVVAPRLLRKPEVATPASAPRAVTVIEAKTAEPLTVPVDALPPSAKIESGMTLVRFGDSAAGHRVYVDDALSGSGEQPMKMRCGKHTIKIGSQGKPRDVDLPCGRETLVEP